MLVASHKFDFMTLTEKKKNCHKRPPVVTETKEFWSALMNCYLNSRLHFSKPDNIKGRK